MKLPSIEGAQRVTGDALSLGMLLGWAMDWLPAAATLMTFLWTGICVWESKTFQWLIGRGRGKAVVE